MSRKNIQHIQLNSTDTQRKNQSIETFNSAEDIAIQSVYSKADIANLEHLNFAAGITPNLRGPYSTMYVEDPGLYGNMQVFRPPKIVMPSINEI